VRTGRGGRNPAIPVLQHIDRAITDHSLEEGHELGGRGAAKLGEAPGIKRRQGVSEDVVRVSRRESEGSEGAAADLLERRQKGPPSLGVAIPTAFHQIEEVRANGLLLRCAPNLAQRPTQENRANRVCL